MDRVLFLMSMALIAVVVFHLFVWLVRSVGGVGSLAHVKM